MHDVRCALVVFVQPAVGLSIVASLLSGCGGGETGGPSENGGADGGGAASDANASGGVVLSVDSAFAPATVGGVAPAAGSAFLVLSLTLANTGATSPLSTNPVLFAVTTQQSLVIAPSAAQAPNECSPSVSVAAGGRVACSVAFELPSGQTPATVRYDDRRGDFGVASVPAIAAPSAACETVQGWLGKHDTACVQCLTQSASSDAGAGSCVAASSTYGSSCKGCFSSCVGGAGDPCACETSCDSTTCGGLFDAYMRCLASTCSASCP